jgi:hypothetical protein
MRSSHSISAMVLSASIVSIIQYEAEFSQTETALVVPDRFVRCQSIRQRQPATGTQNSFFGGVPRA